MLDGIPLALLPEVGGWLTAVGVILGVARLMYKGKLVAASTVQSDREALAAERETNAELRAALLEHLTIGSTAVHLLESIQREREEGEGK